MTIKFVLCQEISSCDRKFLPVTRNVFKRQEISSSAMKVPTHNLFLRKEHYSGGKNFLQYLIPSDIKKRMELLTGTIPVNNFQRFS